MSWKQADASGIGDVAVSPDGTVWVAGTNGTVWFSHDHGSTFSQVQASDFARIASASATWVWAAGQNGTLWAYDTTSSTWHKVLPAEVVDVAVGPDGRVWIAKIDGTIWSKPHSIIGPLTGTFGQITASGFARVAVSPAGVLWAVGSNGSLWSFSAEREPNWIKTAASDIGDVGVETTADAQSFATDGRIWLAGLNGTVWVTLDNGVNFTQLEADGASSIAGAAATSKAPTDPQSGLQLDRELAWCVTNNGLLWFRPAIPEEYAPFTPTHGPTPHFSVQYDVVLGQGGRNVADQLCAIAESQYNKMSSLFGAEPANLPILLSVDDLTGGGISGTGSIDIHTGVDSMQAEYVFSSELAEIFMRAQSSGAWNPNDSKGEALSRYLGASFTPFFVLAGSGYLTANSWLNSSRPNWIDQPEATDQDFVSIGCSILFLNYMVYKLGLSIDDVVQNKSATLAGVYQSLTGRSDGWTSFQATIDGLYPPGTPTNLTTDNPWVPAP